MAAASSQTLCPLPILVFLLAVATTDAATFTIINNCSISIWPALTPVGAGQRLDSGQVWTLDVPAGTSAARLWGRTGCYFNTNGQGNCLAGDCDGELSCTSTGQQPLTLAEFALGGEKDFFGISIIDGFNLPMEFLGLSGCGKGSRCLGDTPSQCPDAFISPSGDGKIFSCPGGTNYQVVFCPPFKETVIKIESSESPQTKGYMIGNEIPEPPQNNGVDPITGYMIGGASPEPPPNNGVPPITGYVISTNATISMTLSPQTAPTIQTRNTSPGPVAEGTRSSSNIRAINIRAIMILAPIAGFIFLNMLLVICFICMRGRWRQEMEEAEDFGELQGMPMRFTFQQLKVATNDFRDKLGEGGFGTVFKGQIGEEIIAVKRLDRTGQGKKEFSDEVLTIGGIHHINLVRLIGFCAEKSQRLLVYEFMPNGSLDKWIYYQQENNNVFPLDWEMRCKIITHIAKGLSYLHEECSKRIAHLDVKPQNILLDDNFNAKLSDFGLCKLIDRDKSEVITRMRGTPGYLAPEWLTSQITEKADIYSFGIVVMEIISGRKNLDTTQSEESVHLITLLEKKLMNGQLEDLIDKKNNNMQAHKPEVIRIMKLAMWCLQVDRKRRPQMSDVVKVLEGIMDVETNIDHTFVATSQTIFGIARNVAPISSPPQASKLSGPR